MYLNEMALIKTLAENLNRYRDNYYNNSYSEITDTEYDKEFDRLKNWNREQELF